MPLTLAALIFAQSSFPHPCMSCGLILWILRGKTFGKHDYWGFNNAIHMHLCLWINRVLAQTDVRRHAHKIEMLFTGVDEQPE